jgi:succinate dehydrogenase/fumarate reductase cytochrome b subunit
MDVREDFCNACLAVPMAIMSTGAGIAGYSMSKEEYYTRRKWLIIGAIVSLVISIVIYFWNKSCDTCSF